MTTITQSEALDREALSGREHTKFWRARRWHQLECLRAEFVRHVYAPHTHDTYAFGVIENGTEFFRYRSAEHRAPSGSVVILDPFELHDGRPAPGGYRYRMMYPAPELMAEVVTELGERPHGTPWFSSPVISDPLLARHAVAAHAALEGAAGKLAEDTILIEALALLVSRHAESRPVPIRVGPERPVVARLCDYIEAHLGDDMSLARLAEVAGMSRFRVIRVFRRELGLTPYAYVLSKRVTRARDHLAAGGSPAETAYALGFADQAHFTRVFKAMTGVTPARFRVACRA
jgi:AraC-like DNA-binding protein